MAPRELTGGVPGQCVHHNLQEFPTLPLRRLVDRLQPSIRPFPSRALHPPAHLPPYTAGTDRPLAGVVIPRDPRVSHELEEMCIRFSRFRETRPTSSFEASGSHCRRTRASWRAASCAQGVIAEAGAFADQSTASRSSARSPSANLRSVIGGCPVRRYFGEARLLGPLGSIPCVTSTACRYRLMWIQQTPRFPSARCRRIRRPRRPCLGSPPRAPA